MVTDLDGVATGCARLHLGTAIPADLLDAMQVMAEIASDGYRCGYVSKLMVERSLRGRGDSLQLMMSMIERAAAAGCQYGIFHCNPRLCRLYERYGFERFGNPFELAHVGTQVSMVTLFGDAAHFARIRSPLSHFVRRFEIPQARIGELRQMFRLIVQ